MQTSVPPGGGALAFDFDRNPRVHGAAIDQGAVEYTPLFEKGFEKVATDQEVSLQPELGTARCVKLTLVYKGVQGD